MKPSGNLRALAILFIIMSFAINAPVAYYSASAEL